MLVVDKFSLDAPKTKVMVEFLSRVDSARKPLYHA